LYVKDLYKCERSDSPFTKPVEAIKIELNRPNLAKIDIILVYRVSNTKKSFEQELEELLRNSSTETYLIGDLNNDLKKSSEPSTISLNNIISSSNFEQVISKPTRVTPTSKSLIDVIILNRKALCQSSGTLNEVIADHSIIYTIRKKPRCVKCPRKVISTRSFKNINEAELRRLIRTAPWWILETKADIEEKFILFLDICKSILNIFAPVKRKRVRILKPYWMTSTYEEVCSKVGKAKKEAHRVNSPEKWAEFKSIRNKSFHLKHRMKMQSIKQKVEEETNIDDSKMYWKLFNDEVGRSKRAMAIPTIYHNGRQIDDTLEKLNIFNKSFLKSFPLPANSSPTLEETECERTLEQIQLTSEDIQYIIQNMERNKPTGADGLPPIFFKICANEISPVLTDQIIR